MPFRIRQRMQSYAAGVITYTVGTPNQDTGIIEYRDVEQNGPRAVLPSPEMMDLAACLKAGVSLDRVNCKLISTDSHALAEYLNGIKEDEPNPEPASNGGKPNEE